MHNPVDLVVEVPRPVVVEKSVQVPMIQVEEKTVRVPKVLNTVVDTVVQHQIENIHVMKPTVVHKVVQRRKPIIQERIQHVPKIMVQHVPVQKIVEKQVHVPQVQYVDEFVDVPVQKQRRATLDGEKRQLDRRWRLEVHED